MSIRLEDLWRQYQSAIRRFLNKRLSNSADVEDLMQDILLKTHLGLDQLQQSQSIRAWIFQIAQRQLIDFYRRQARQTNLAAQSQDEIINNYLPPEQNLETELGQCLLPFISSLPQENAELLIAIDLQGMEQKHYAAEQGINYSTLKSRLQKSRQLLASLFTNCCSFYYDNEGRQIQEKQNSCDC